MPEIHLEDPDSTLRMLRDSVAGVSVDLDGPGLMRLRRAAHGDLDLAAWRAMAQAGWLGLPLPENAGGLGLGPAELAIVSEGLGRHLMSEPFGTLAVFPGTLLALLGGDLALRLAAGIADGSQILPVLWQDARGTRRALRVDSNATISGTAHFVSGAKAATGFIVLARQDEQDLLLHVDAETPGLGLSSRPGVDGSMLGAVTLERVELAACMRLDQEGGVADAFETAIAWTRLSLAAELAGNAARAFEDTAAYTTNRVQFGKPIAANQVVQHRLVDMWADAEFACAAVANAVETLAKGSPQEAALSILAAKARAGDAATSITRRAVHLHGAMGFTDQCDIGLYLKRAISLNATLGQPEDLRLAFLDAERAA